MTRERWEEIRRALLDGNPLVTYTNVEWLDFLKLARFGGENEAVKDL